MCAGCFLTVRIMRSATSFHSESEICMIHAADAAAVVITTSNYSAKIMLQIDD